jgi:hypothetical protein
MVVVAGCPAARPSDKGNTGRGGEKQPVGLCWRRGRSSPKQTSSSPPYPITSSVSTGRGRSGWLRRQRCRRGREGVLALGVLAQLVSIGHGHRKR